MDEARVPSSSSTDTRHRPDEIIVIAKVGPEKKSFTMHKETLCKVSQFFRSALMGNFKEARTRVIEFPEVEVEVFRVFQTWLYTRRLLFVADMPYQPWKALSWELLIDLYIFGESRFILELLNPVMDILIKKPAVIADLPFRLVSYIYENTYSGSELRRWISHAMAYATLHLGHLHLIANAQKLPIEFRQDAAAASWIAENRGCCRDGLISVFHRCDYHIRDCGGYCLKSPSIDGERHRWATIGRLAIRRDDGGHVWFNTFWKNRTA